MGRLARTFAAAAFLFVWADAEAEETTIPPSLAASGADLYRNRCEHCHGPKMVTVSGAVYDLRRFPLDDEDRFRTSVLNGRNAMPAWRGVLTDGDIDALWAYVQTRGKE